MVIMQIKEAIGAFADHLVKNQYAHLTVRNYQEALNEFSQAVGETLDVKDLTSDILRSYREKVAGLSVSDKTKNLRLIPVRRLLGYLNERSLTSIPQEVIPVFRAKNGKKPLDLISREELKKYLEYKDTPRNDLLVHLLYDTGLRVAELLSLDVSDVKQEFEVRGKGGRERTIFISPQVWKMVVDYIGDRKDGALFLSNQGRVSKVWVERIVKERGERLGMSKPMTPHKLRHLYATHYYEDGVDLNTLREMLGHSSLGTTQIYARVSVERMREARKKKAEA